MPLIPWRARPRRAAILSLWSVLLASGPAGGTPLGAQPPVTPPPPPRIAPLGTCRLAGGAVVSECRVAYRTFGKLAAARDNVVLIPTFFAGRSEDHLFMLATYVDTTRYHVVIADALADGHSSSPSNTRGGDTLFAALTIGDMVATQHRLLTEHLAIHHLRAVVGISMGGFEAFEWAVRFPDFADAVVPIVATPRVPTHDRLNYTLARRVVEDGRGADVDSTWRHASRWEALFMRTPRFLNDSGEVHLARSIEELAGAYRAAGWSPADYAAQLRAIAAHDVAARFGGDLTRAAAAVRARLLVVASPDDRMVDPAPGVAFARRVGAETLVAPSSCGHAVFWCEAERLGDAVRAFVARAPALPPRAATGGGAAGAPTTP
jgi:homoserine O-acetyltransferase/O-succinyltransferase